MGLFDYDDADRSQYPAKRDDGSLDIDLASGKYLKLWQGPQHPGITGNMSLELTVCGDEVVEGQVIGYVGATGLAQAPHLHYEVRQLDPVTRAQTPLDPRIFILDHDWSERESWLVASRKAPPPAVDPLPVFAGMGEAGAGVAAAFGVALGGLFHTLLAAAGLAVLLQAYPVAFGDGHLAGTGVLARTGGPRNACETTEGQRAQHGLDEVALAVPAGELDNKVDEIVGKLQGNPRWAVRWTKSVVNIPLRALAAQMMDAAIGCDARAALEGFGSGSEPDPRFHHDRLSGLSSEADDSPV